ncbi:MAG: polymer-forming cytoskeletal protein [Patescibacteria group bacterium]
MNKIFVAVLTLLLISPLMVRATTTESGETYALGSQDTILGNLYAAGGTVQISGNVEGDALVAGGTVTVTGHVTDDLMAAGGTVLLIGSVDEDVRIAGGNVTVIGDIGGEIIGAGGLVTLSPDVVVKGDAFLSGGTVIIDGLIEGNVEVYAEEVQILGKVNGSVIGKMTKLTIDEGAEIGGNLAYESPAQALVAATSVIAGSIDFKQIELPQITPPDIEGAMRNFSRAIAGLMVLFMFIRYIALLTAGIVLVLWFNKKSELLVMDSLQSFGNNLLIGLAIMLAGPIAFIVLLFTGVGSVFGILGLSLMSVAYVIGCIYGGIVLGVLVRRMWSKSNKVPTDWKSALLGITLISLVAVIPIVGWLVKAILVLAVIGSVCKLKYQSLQTA